MSHWKGKRVRIWLLSLLLVIEVVLFNLRRSPPSELPSISPPIKILQYQSHSLPRSTVHTLFIPAGGDFVVTPALAPELDTLEGFAQKHQAAAALNGGFFDPANRKATSYVVLQGKQQADPRLNERLMNNPDLMPYLNKILDRTEFRRYQCKQTIQYDIALHSQLPPAGCQLIDALGGGPRLLPKITAVPEGFLAYANGEVIRDPLNSKQPDARTAVGITRDGNLIWAMVARKPGVSTAGMSLLELADFLKALGVEQAMNLDGGSSSSLYYQGKTFYGKVNEAGNLVRRPIKSVLLVQVLSR